MFGLKGSSLPEREPGLANGGTYYYLTDALGSPTHLTDQKGEVAPAYRYDAFGGLFTGTVGLYSTTGLTGKAYDPKTGLMDYSARWYDPSVGRFTQPDPFQGYMDVPMSQHAYSFVYNNPVNYTDPTGMETCTGWYESWSSPGLLIERNDCSGVEKLEDTTSGVGGKTEHWTVWDVEYWKVKALQWDNT